MRPVSCAVLIVLFLGSCGGDGRPAAGAATPRQQTSGTGAADGIVPDRSIGPVRIGMTQDELRAALGDPEETAPSELHVGWERWTYRSRDLTLTLTERDEVWDVRTRSERYRSNHGLQVGLHEGEIRRRLPRAKCQAYGGPRRYRRWRVCTSRTSEFYRPHTRVLLIRHVAREIRVMQGLAR